LISILVSGLLCNATYPVINPLETIAYGAMIMKAKLVLATTWLTSEPWRMRALVTAALLAMSLAAGGGVVHAGEASSGGGG
jgi:hypothetical protein